MKKRRDTRGGVDNKKPVDDADAEAAHFARAMADVTRIKPDPRGRADPSVKASRAGVDPSITAQRRRTDVDSVPASHIDAGDNAGFAAPGVDRRELRKLKRGDHAPGDSLDLHGMIVADAIARVERFIDHSRSLHRCVCIVHGRGLHSAGQIAILKTQVRACLRRHPAVLAYSDAPRGDGGSGAVYVLLRKSKSLRE